MHRVSTRAVIAAIGVLLAALAPARGAAAPSGYAPQDLWAAYGTTAVALTRGVGHAVAVISAYDDPTAGTDLAVYRAAFHLPSCTSANGCFRVVNERGQAVAPKPSAAWAEEDSVDLDMVSAGCPRCAIWLVEADTSEPNDIAAAISTAAAEGVSAIATTFVAGESALEAPIDAALRRVHVPVTAAAGDSGHGVDFPSSSPWVVSVGGTTLIRSGTPRGWSETVWSESGGGCSVREPKPAWQHDPLCANRTANDLAFVADPKTPVAAYDTYAPLTGDYALTITVDQHPAATGWIGGSGTRVGAAYVAGLLAMTGGHRAPGFLYAEPASHFWDVTSGANGGGISLVVSSLGSCGSYLCQAGPGYDAPSGRGTPRGLL